MNQEKKEIIEQKEKGIFEVEKPLIEKQYAVFKGEKKMIGIIINIKYYTTVLIHSDDKMHTIHENILKDGSFRFGIMNISDNRCSNVLAAFEGYQISAAMLTRNLKSSFDATEFKKDIVNNLLDVKIVEKDPIAKQQFDEMIKDPVAVDKISKILIEEIITPFLVQAND